jgi:hypothetical protein
MPEIEISRTFAPDDLDLAGFDFRVGFGFCFVLCSKWMQLENREYTLMDGNSGAFVSIRGFSCAPFWCWHGQIRILDLGFRIFSP